MVALINHLLTYLLTYPPTDSRWKECHLF